MRRHVTLRRSNDAHVPLTWGWFWPVVLLPHDADDWNEELRAAVLLHELSHVRRGDCLTQQLAHLACALHWHNPLAWLAARQMRRERERACDDEVVLAGVRSSDYADLLVSLAQGHPTPRNLGIAAVAMGRSSADNLELRVRAILDPHRDRRGIGRTSTRLGLAVASVIVLAFSSVRLTAQADPEPSISGATIRGRVLDPDGKPVAGATVAVLARSRSIGRGGDITSAGTRGVATTTTDDSGAFQIGPKPPISSSLYRDVKLMASSPRFAPSGRGIGLDAEEIVMDVSLQQPRRIKGRLADSVGQPAPGVVVHVTAMRKPGYDLLAGLMLTKPEPDLPGWPRPAKTDADGRYILDGLPANLEINLNIKDDTYAIQSVGKVLVGTGDAEVNATLDPAQPIEGLITDSASGEPIAGARLSVFSSMKTDGSYGGVDGVANQQGRYRIHPIRGNVFHVTAYPPDSSPCLIVKQEFDWPKGAASHKVDLALPRGVLIRGKITEMGTEKPVVGASIQYYPRRDNVIKPFRDVITSGSAAVLSDSDGAFQIAVIPGKGHLLIHAPNMDYVLREIGEHVILDGKPGGQRFYAHAIVPYDVNLGDDPPEVSATLKPAVSVTGRLVGPGGESVDEAILISRLSIFPLSPYYRGFTELIRGGLFTIHGCDPDQTIPVHFLDPKNQWGQTVEISGKEAGKPMTIKLSPCGSATVRLVDSEGKPLVNLFPMIHLAVTPGPTVQGLNRQGFDELFADEGLLPNLDHRNYGNNHKKRLTDADGRATLPALIPGAHYRIHGGVTQGGIGSKIEFTVLPGTQMELHEIELSKPR